MFLTKLKRVPNRPLEPGFTYVDRHGKQGKLCLIRKTQRSIKYEQEELKVVFNNSGNERSKPEEQKRGRAQHHVHDHKHEHHHFIHGNRDRPSHNEQVNRGRQPERHMHHHEHRHEHHHFIHRNQSRSRERIRRPAQAHHEQGLQPKYEVRRPRQISPSPSPVRSPRYEIRRPGEYSSSPVRRGRRHSPSPSRRSAPQNYEDSNITNFPSRNTRTTYSPPPSPKRSSTPARKLLNHIKFRTMPSPSTRIRSPSPAPASVAQKTAINHPRAYTIDPAVKLEKISIDKLSYQKFDMEKLRLERIPAVEQRVNSNSRHELESGSESEHEYKSTAISRPKRNERKAYQPYVTSERMDSGYGSGSGSSSGSGAEHGNGHGSEECDSGFEYDRDVRVFDDYYGADVILRGPHVRFVDCERRYSTVSRSWVYS